MKEHDVDSLLSLFGLNKNFTQSQLKQSYKDLVQVWHPDKYLHNPRLKHKAEEKLKEINSAYKTLEVYCANAAGPSTKDYAQSSPDEGHQQANTYPKSTGRYDKGSDGKRKGFPGRYRRAYGYVFFFVIIGLLGLAHTLMEDDIPFSQDEEIPALSNSRFPALSKVDRRSFLRSDGPEAPREVPALKPATKLDARYGFRTLRFGMTHSAMEHIVTPSESHTYASLSRKMATFEHSDLNSFENNPLEKVQGYFFEDKLYRIDLSFTQNPDGVFEICRTRYGEPVTAHSEWRVGEEKVAAASWTGNRVSASILDTRGDKKWDTLVIYKKGLAQKAERHQWLQSGEFRSDSGFERLRKKFHE
jgi:hypothetical protein